MVFINCLMKVDFSGAHGAHHADVDVAARLGDHPGRVLREHGDEQTAVNGRPLLFAAGGYRGGLTPHVDDPGHSLGRQFERLLDRADVAFGSREAAGFPLGGCPA